MRKLLRAYSKLEENILVASLVVTVVLIFVQVVMRYVFNNSLSWSEELARYIFIWQIWLGASVGIRLKRQICVEMLTARLNAAARRWMSAFALFILLAFCIFLVVNGYHLSMKIASRNAVSSALSIPLSIVYMSLPFSSAVTCLYIVDQLIELVNTPAKKHLGGI
ncbi:TRAP transporter small permease [Desulforhopalus singaporensis]|uniref:TRAP-type C4-dicarboxylate transport system, small permease component n=1 Tax=Desulforhopalus singaporensis TaxID=91360 RepID=A0A1H0UDX0_9BACT|nr:TRAP transporter small permease [Desulforhopalus singaporensis]SDP64215.1 TRAP-type C4-dicarboxylate transport system, small permease component [Desulforhopalus singaporensis]